MLYFGSQKLLGAFGGRGLEATIQGMVEKQGIPQLFAYFAVAGEFFGGLGLLVGLLSRVAAFGVGCTMAVASFINLRHPDTLPAFAAGNGSQVAKFGFPFVLCCMAVALLLIGPGRWSLDARFLGQKGRRKA